MEENRSRSDSKPQFDRSDVSSVSDVTLGRTSKAAPAAFRPSHAAPRGPFTVRDARANLRLDGVALLLRFASKRHWPLPTSRPQTLRPLRSALVASLAAGLSGLGAACEVGALSRADALFDAPRMTAQLIHSHASDDEIGKIYTADLPLHAGPNRMAAALADITASQPHGRVEWYGAARDAYLQSLVPPAQPGDVDMGVITVQIQAQLPDDAIITHGAGNFAIWVNKFMQFGRDQRLLGPQSGSMGFGVPAALAAKAHDSNRFVLCFAGDGDFQMNGTELGTALQAGLHPVILVLNNSSYGTIRMHQEREYPARVSGTEIVNPDYVALAGAYGFHGERVTRTDDFASAYARALAAPAGAIIEIVIDTEAIAPRSTISDLRAAAG